MALTAKQEAFARIIALEKLDQSTAYAKACDVSRMTPKSVMEAASRMAADPQVKTRIQVIAERATAAAVKKMGYTLADAIREADELVADGQALGQVSAAVAASKLKATLAGHLAEKKEKEKGALDDLDVDGLLKVRQEVEARLQRAVDALEMTGIEPTRATPAMRRVA